MGLHSVTCHPAEVTFPPLRPACRRRRSIPRTSVCVCVCETDGRGTPDVWSECSLRRCGGESHDAFSRQLPQQLGADICSESRIDRRRKCAVEAHQSERLVISPTLLHSEIFTVHVLDVVDFFCAFSRPWCLFSLLFIYYEKQQSSSFLPNTCNIVNIVIMFTVYVLDAVHLFLYMFTFSVFFVFFVHLLWKTAVILHSLLNTCNSHFLPSVLWCCWLGIRKSIRPLKMSDEVLVWLSVWSEVHMVQLMPLHPQTPVISCHI